MTTAVRIVNEGPRQVAVSTISPTGERSEDKIVEPGAHLGLYVHAQQSLHIDEVPTQVGG